MIVRNFLIDRLREKRKIMKAIWNNQVIAESEDIINVEGNSYFPVESVNKEFLKASGIKGRVAFWKGVEAVRE